MRNFTNDDVSCRNFGKCLKNIAETRGGDFFRVLRFKFGFLCAHRQPTYSSSFSRTGSSFYIFFIRQMIYIPLVDKSM
ncbi:hypothetical protein L2E82_50909 [Cichorium intybus]|nr:hypothetical protein L2E82_50909 [Cichorium intybus]